MAATQQSTPGTVSAATMNVATAQQIIDDPASVYIMDEVEQYEYEGELLFVKKFSGTSRKLNAQLTRQCQVGTLVFCNGDGVIAKRTSTEVTDGTNLFDWWEFYGDMSREFHLQWDESMTIPGE